MTGNLLDFFAKNGNWYFENFGEALIYALIGFLIVFAGITLIIVIIWLIGLLLRKTNNLAFLRGLGGKIRSKLSKSKDEESVSSPEAVQPADGEIPAEIKAAIMAAIMAYYVEEAPECEFSVKRIKRI